MSTCAHGYVAQYVDIVTQEYLRRLCMDVHMDACMDVLTNLYGCLYTDVCMDACIHMCVVIVTSDLWNDAIYNDDTEKRGGRALKD